MGDRALPRFFLRTVMIVTTWVAGAAFAAHVPDVAAERRAEELAPVVPFMNPGPDHPAQNPPANVRPETHSGSKPAEAPPLVEPPSPTPA